MSRLPGRVITTMLILFLMVYAGYQARRFLHNPVKTDTAYEYTVSKTISTKGIAIREEQVLEDAVTGTEFYPLNDASRVALGETVAERQPGGRSEQNTKKARELETEILQLQEAQNTAVDYVYTETYNRDIKTKLGKLAAMSGEGRYYGVGDLRQGLTLSINKKQISTGKVFGFAQRISGLQSELQGLNRSAATETAQVVQAPAAGYFSKSVDGYEVRLTPNSLDGMKVADYLRLMEQEIPAAGPPRVGKMVLSEKWIFAASVPGYNMEWIKQGQQVDLQFESISDTVPATVSQIIEERDNDTAVLLLSCNRMNEELVNLRVASVVLHFQKYTGIRIDSANLRFRVLEDGSTERGVYTLRNNMVYFRLVDPIYEEPSFLLTRTYYTAEEYLEPQRQARRKAQEEAPEPDPPDLSLEEQEKAGQDAALTDDYKRYVILFDQIVTKGFVHDGQAIQDS